MGRYIFSALPLMHIAYQNVQMEEDNHVTCKMETIKEKAGKKYVQMGKES